METPMNYPISLVAIVRNAKGRVKTLIERHKDVVAETIIIDQGSTDGTYEEALQCADKVFKRRCKGTADPDRNWAFSLASQPYVLYLDDDEYLTDAAKSKLPEIMATDAEIFWFKRSNYVDGISINEILGDDIQCRLFKKGAVRFPDQIHTYPEAAVRNSQGRPIKTFYLDVAIRHDRTLEGLKASNKAREVVADEKAKALQDKFVADVEALLKAKDGFSENWYSAEQLQDLKAAVAKTKALKGLNIEIGCWEGKSTCLLANEVYPESIFAVDTWQGNIAEGEDHPSVVLAKERNVFDTFQTNVKTRTKGNVEPKQQDCFEFLAALNSPVKFCHIDAAHDYESVKRTIEMLKPYLVDGAVLCGDDFQSANIRRLDLQGGVERAVKECCPGFVAKGNFWQWVCKK
jgi:hypothetical protein